MEAGPMATDSGDRTTDGPTRGDCLALLANMCCRLSRLNLLNEPQTLRQTTQATATGGTYHQEKGVDTGRGGEGGTHVPTLILLSYWRPKPNGARQELDADKRGQKFAYFRIARQSLLPTSLHSPLPSPSLFACPHFRPGCARGRLFAVILGSRRRRHRQSAGVLKGPAKLFRQKSRRHISAHMLQAIFVIIIYRCLQNCKLRGRAERKNGFIDR